MRAIKLVAFALLGVAVLLAVVLVGVWLFVNPNDYKGRIAQQVKTATGRELTLSGDIKLSVFPWVALELGPASLGNPAGFAAEPFVSVQHAALRVKLLPLLHKELVIGRVQVDGMDLRLKKNAEGKGNWEGFGKQSADQPAAASSGPTALPELAGVAIHSSRVSYETTTLSNLNLDIGSLAPKTPVPITATFDVDRGAGSSPLSVTAALNLTLDTAAKRYDLDAVNLSGTLKPKTDPRAIAWRLAIPSVDLDLAAQTLKAPAFTAQFAQANLSGSLSGEKIVDAPAIAGAFKLEPLVLREFMNRLSVDPPKTRDPQALSKLAAAANFAYGGNALKLDKLDVQLDESTLTGSVAVTNLDTKALRFDLNLDHIDVDHYLSPENAPATKPDGKPSELPSEQIKALDANGSVGIGRAKIAGVDLINVRVSVEAKDGVVHVAPAKASLYGGQYSGDITYDVQGAAPALKLDQTMTGIDIAQLLKASVKSDRLSGRGNASTKLVGHGLTSDALIKSLSGRVDANLADGAVEGIDLWYEISLAESLIKQQGIPAGSSSGRTKFDTFKMSADIANGVATTKDLNIASSQLRVTGQGSANLTTKAIDYRIIATILKAPPTAKGPDLSHLALAAIPVNITGTMSAPKVKPDLEGIAKAKLQQKLDEKKDELKQKLQDKLKGIFGN